MDPRRPTKTFGLASAMDVLLKLDHDIARLRAATASTYDLRYAALDCVIWSFHLIDWVLNEVDDDAHRRLTGGRSRTDRGTSEAFLKTNIDRLPALSVCEQLANTGKHRSRRPHLDDATLETRQGARFNPPLALGGPFPQDIKIQVYGRIVSTDPPQEVDVIVFFEAVRLQWEYFLRAEGLFIDGFFDEPE